MVSLPKWVNLMATTPVAENFNTTQGSGTPINIRNSSGFGYFLNQAGVPTLLGGNALGFATRAALAAAPVPPLISAYLSEAGREGEFVWSGANLSAFVTADPNQGLYVAPASAPTGASGAWVRKFDGPLNVLWFGAVADDPGVGAFGTDNAAAFQDAFNVAQFLSHIGYINSAIYRGGPSVYFPAGYYYTSASLVPLFTGKIFGDGGKGWGAATHIRFAAGVDGLQLQAHNTSGKTTYDGVAHYAGDSLYIADMSFYGAYAGVESEAHGCRAKRTFTLERCVFENFEGDGFYCNVDFGSGLGTTEGNTNVARIIDCQFNGNRRGRYMKGSDANAINLFGCSYSSNRQWGVCEASFLGNHEFGAHFDANARDVNNLGTAAKPASYAFNNGHVFFVIAGQEAYCAANSPPATATDSTGWGYWMDQGVATVSVPQWAGGMTWRAGGPVYQENDNNNSRFDGLHIEGNGVSQIGQGCLMMGNIGYVVFVNGGVMVRNRARTITAGSNGITVGSTLQVNGGLYSSEQNNFGPLSGATVGDGLTLFGSRNTSHNLVFRTFDAAGNMVSDVGFILFNSTFGSFFNVAAGKAHTFRVNNANIASLDGTGWHVTGSGDFTSTLTASGAITSSSATGGMGYATGAGGAVTQITSKSTATPAINKTCGQVTMHNAALAAGAKVSFVVTNSTVAATDTIIVSVASGGTANAYRANVTAISAGASFTVTVENITAGSLSEAPVINFAIIKAVSA